MDPETLITFMFQAPYDVLTVELLGSWDGFSKGYRMHHDRRRCRGFWSGCFKFTDIVFDGFTLDYSRPRNGGLKQGGKYWYYFRLNDDVEAYDDARDATADCPLLPGQMMNVIEIPSEVVEAPSRCHSAGAADWRLQGTLSHYDQWFGGRDVAMEPDMKYMPVLPPPVSKVHLRCVSDLAVNGRLEASRPTSSRGSPDGSPPSSRHVASRSSNRRSVLARWFAKSLGRSSSSPKRTHLASGNSEDEASPASDDYESEGESYVDRPESRACSSGSYSDGRLSSGQWTSPAEDRDHEGADSEANSNWPRTQRLYSPSSRSGPVRSSHDEIVVSRSRPAHLVQCYRPTQPNNAGGKTGGQSLMEPSRGSYDHISRDDNDISLSAIARWVPSAHPNLAGHDISSQYEETSDLGLEPQEEAESPTPEILSSFTWPIPPTSQEAPRFEQACSPAFSAATVSSAGLNTPLRLSANYSRAATSAAHPDLENGVRDVSSRLEELHASSPQWQQHQTHQLERDRDANPQREELDRDLTAITTPPLPPPAYALPQTDDVPSHHHHLAGTLDGGDVTMPIPMKKKKSFLRPASSSPHEVHVQVQVQQEGTALPRALPPTVLQNGEEASMLDSIFSELGYLGASIA